MEFNKLNIDRLHYNIQGIIEREDGLIHLPSGSGKTFGYLYLMLGEVWMGNLYRDFLYIARHRHQSQSAAFRFSRLLTKEGIDHRVEQHNSTNGVLIVIEDTAQRFQFIHYDVASIEHFWIGRHIWRLFLDVQITTDIREAVDNVILPEIKMSGGDII